MSDMKSKNRSLLNVCFLGIITGFFIIASSISLGKYDAGYILSGSAVMLVSWYVMAYNSEPRPWSIEMINIQTLVFSTAIAIYVIHMYGHEHNIPMKWFLWSVLSVVVAHIALSFLTGFISRLGDRNRHKNSD